MRVFFLSSILFVMIFSVTMSFAYAHPHIGQVSIDDHTHQPQTEIIPLNEMIGIEKTTIFFNTPENNNLPWGFVEGKISNPVEGYPVIIQIFRNGDAVHFAQTDVEKDGSYEYKFRVLNYDNGEQNKIFDGNYKVKIFKVVYLNQYNII